MRLLPIPKQASVESDVTRVIEVVEYAPEWIAAFATEAQMLAPIFGPRLLAIHHIGSTAVPGLQAKPIIDILVVLDDTSDVTSFTPAMEALGYRARGECLDTLHGTPGRFYFSKDTNAVRTHQVHVCATGHPQIADLLAFRDYLRANDCEAVAYGELKRRLAGAYRFDSVAYNQTKGEFVRTATEVARHLARTRERDA